MSDRTYESIQLENMKCFVLQFVTLHYSSVCFKQLSSHHATLFERERVCICMREGSREMERERERERDDKREGEREWESNILKLETSACIQLKPNRSYNVNLEIFPFCLHQFHNFSEEKKVDSDFRKD